MAGAVTVREARLAEEGDIELLCELGDSIKKASLCGLGQTAPNPALTTIKYFREEYEAHIHDHKCPGKTCKALIKFTIDPEADRAQEMLRDAWSQNLHVPGQ